MSKTQDKRALRKQEAEDFVRTRRVKQIAFFEHNFDIGLKMYEQGKDQLSEEEVAVLEEQIKENRSVIDNLKQQWGLK